MLYYIHSSLADELGFGKTIQTISFLALPRERKAKMVHMFTLRPRYAVHEVRSLQHDLTTRDAALHAGRLAGSQSGQARSSSLIALHIRHWAYWVLHGMTVSAYMHCMQLAYHDKGPKSSFPSLEQRCTPCTQQLVTNLHLESAKWARDGTLSAYDTQGS